MFHSDPAEALIQEEKLGCWSIGSDSWGATSTTEGQDIKNISLQVREMKFEALKRTEEKVSNASFVEMSHTSKGL